jgi:hypothetical protein
MHELLMDERFMRLLIGGIHWVSEPVQWARPPMKVVNRPRVLRNHSIYYRVVSIGQNPTSSRRLVAGFKADVKHFASGVVVDIPMRLPELLIPRTAGFSIGGDVVGVLHDAFMP